MAKNANKKAESEPEIFRVPNTAWTEHFYKDSLFASMELNKFCSRIVKNKAWPVKNNFPNLFLIGMENLLYPDVGAFDPEKDLYGPGLKAFALMTGNQNSLGPLTSGIKNKLDVVNKYVVLVELLNPEKVFGTKLNMLCSDWTPPVSTKCRSASTDGVMFIFHPKIDDEVTTNIKCITDALNIEMTEHIRPHADFIKNDLYEIRKEYITAKEEKKYLKKLDTEIKRMISSLNNGIFWSPKKPELLQNEINAFTRVLKEQENFESDALKKIRKLVGQYCYSDSVYQGRLRKIQITADDAVKVYTKMLLACGSLSEFQGIRSLSYIRSKVSAIKLTVSGYSNAIQNDEEAKFKALHIFKFDKNVEARVSKQKAFPMHKQSSLHYLEAVFYDEFYLKETA